MGSGTNFFGQQVATAFADNGSLLTNLVDYFAGSQDLISVRSRERLLDRLRWFNRCALRQRHNISRRKALQLELNETGQLAS